MRALFAMGRGRDQRLETGGAVMVEFLIAYLPVLISFLMFWQLGELIVAQMIVDRASSAAGRAAVVVLPDDGAFYDGEPQDVFDGNRKRQIRMAAGMILQASPHLSENFTVDVSNIPTSDDHVDEIGVDVTAEFRCQRLQWVCGLGGLTVLHAASQHTYQGARYEYEPPDLSTLVGNSNTLDPSCSGSDTPNAGGKGNGSGGGSSNPAKGGGFGAGGKSGTGGSGHGGRGNGGSGGNGGADPDQNGSCPPGSTAQADGTCSKARGGGKCKNGTPNPDGMCSDGTCADTGKKPPPGADPKDPCGCPAGSGNGSSCPLQPCPSGQTRNAKNVCSCPANGKPPPPPAPGAGSGTGTGNNGASIIAGSGTQACQGNANSCPCMGTACQGPVTCAASFTSAIDRVLNGTSSSDSVCNGNLAKNLADAAKKAGKANPKLFECEDKAAFQKEMQSDLEARAKKNGDDPSSCGQVAADNVNGAQSCRGFTTLSNKVVMLAPACQSDLLHEWIHMSSGRGGLNGLAATSYNSYNEALTQYLTEVAANGANPPVPVKGAYDDDYMKVVKCMADKLPGGDALMCKAYYDGDSDQLKDALANIYRQKLQAKASPTFTERERLNDPAKLNQFIADNALKPNILMRDVCN